MNPTISPEPFFNRTDELAALDRAWRRPGRSGQMALLTGRRRLGKTYLLQRFLAAGASGREPARPHAYFLAEQTTAAAHRQALAAQLLAALPAEGVAPGELAVSWNALLRHVTLRRSEEERFGLVLDEFPYLVEQSPELPSILQTWWDREGVHSRVFLILCGSQLSAMESLGREGAPLFGRFNAGVLHLQPLRYDEVAAFYAGSPHFRTVETLIMYGVLGGTPRYHALVDTGMPMGREIVALLLRPHGPLENEIRFLLGTQQIREPAPYNAVLAAIAAGRTQFGQIQQITDVDRGALSFYLRSLMALGWIRRELPFDETSDRRGLYRVADPFLAFWYRFIAPLASEIQFADPDRVYETRVAPYLSDFMGLHVFEEICAQWLRRHAHDRLGLAIRRLGRYWSRDGRIEIDLMAELSGGGYLFGECKWNLERPAGPGVLADLRAKVAALPDARTRDAPQFLLCAVGGFSEELVALAADPESRLFLVSGHDLLP